MAIISDIITEAYRESNLIAIGTTETPAEQAEALKLLNRFITTLFGGEAGETLLPINVGSNNVSSDVETFFYDGLEDWFLPLNKRVMLNLTGPKTMKLDPMPQDGSRFGILDVSGNTSTYNFTVEGNGRTIDGNTTLVVDTDGYNEQWFYRADLGDWKKLSNLTLSDEMPFPDEYADVLIIGLAQRLSSRQGKPLAGETIASYQRVIRDFKARYVQRIFTPSELALIRTPGTWWTRYYSGSNKAFLRGDPLW